jgi:hypothetical protein
MMLVGGAYLSLGPIFRIAASPQILRMVLLELLLDLLIPLLFLLLVFGTPADFRNESSNFFLISLVDRFEFIKHL